MATESIKTIKPSGGDYTGLAAWEAGEQGDLVAADEIAVAECYSMNDAAQLNINGWTTDATRYIRIYTPVSERHDGKWNSSKFRKEHNSWVIIVQENFVRIDGLQLQLTRSDGERSAIRLFGPGASSDIRISNNIIRGIISGTAVCEGINFVFGAAPTEVWNNIIYDFINGVTDCCGILVTDGTKDLYNNTVYNCFTGYSRTGGTVNATNCGAAECNTGFSGTINQTTNSSVTPTFEDEGADDFHLASSDTTWHDQGTDDPGSGLFSDDIDGETRSSPWDIGADEVVVVGVDNVVPLVGGGLVNSGLIRGGLV